MVFSGSILYNSGRNPRQISVGPSFYCALNCFPPLVTAVGPTPNAPIKMTAKGKNRHLFSPRFTSQLVARCRRGVTVRRGLSSQQVGLSLSSLSSRSISLRAHHGVFALATAARTFLALSQQQLTSFLFANYPFTRSLRSISWNVAEVGNIVDLRLYSFRTKREAGRWGVCKIAQRNSSLVRLLNSVG